MRRDNFFLVPERTALAFIVQLLAGTASTANAVLPRPNWIGFGFFDHMISAMRKKCGYCGADKLETEYVVELFCGKYVVAEVLVVLEELPRSSARRIVWSVRAARYALRFDLAQPLASQSWVHYYGAAVTVTTLQIPCPE